MEEIRTLYNITGDYLELLNMLEDTELDEETLLDTLEGIWGELETKAEGYGMVIRQLEADAKRTRAEQKYFEDEAEFYKHRADCIENATKRIKARMCKAMDDADLKQIKSERFTFSVAGNGGKQPLIIDGDVPSFYMRVVYEPDKELIREALEKGVQLDFAHLEPRGKHLNIK